MKLSEEKEDEFFNELGRLCDKKGTDVIYQEYNEFNLNAAYYASSYSDEMKTKLGWFQYYCDQFFGVNEDG